ncbi:hypothetical protein Hdeb2414_s0027g00686601 [Helianthus debilis subsp. tardiflorus]
MGIANGVFAIWLMGKRLLWWVYLLFQPNHKCCHRHSYSNTWIVGVSGSRRGNPPLSNLKCWEGICRLGSLSGDELEGGISSAVRGTVHLPFF